jgi:hypothetical protein
MKSENRNLVILIFLILGVIAIPIIYSAIDLFFTDYSLKKNFESIRIGASEEQVIAKLGIPDKQDTKFHLGQYEGFEEKYTRATKSGSKYYLFLYGEIDMIYVVGFNDKNQVLLKLHGGT